VGAAEKVDGEPPNINNVIMYWIAISASSTPNQTTSSPSTEHQAPSSTTDFTNQNSSTSTSGESVRSVSKGQ